jgi:hypothetical protein
VGRPKTNKTCCQKVQGPNLQTTTIGTIFLEQFLFAIRRPSVLVFGLGVEGGG